LKVLRKISLILFIGCIFVNITGFSPDRDSWQQPDRIMDSIGVQPGMVIGEIGAGHGYFTFKLSDRVGTGGKIYANDIKKSVLEEIEDRCIDGNIKNITTVFGETNDPQFADSSLDMSVMMIVFHDFEEPVKMLANLKNSLLPGAKVYIIERDPDKWTHGRGHFWPEEKIINLIEEAGYSVARIMRFLPKDYIFECIPGDAD
jgi:ubiquinone/menaquinone biosynthesis C-methylase UbiE